MTEERLVSIGGRGERELGDLNVVVRIGQSGNPCTPDYHPESILITVPSCRKQATHDLSSPSACRCHRLRFLAYSPTGKPVSLERAHLLRAIEIDGVLQGHPAAALRFIRLLWSENDTRNIFHGWKWTYMKT